MRALKVGQFEKQCTLCRDVLPIDKFYNHSQKRHLYTSRCKICTNKEAVVHRRNNPLTWEQNRKRILKINYGMTWENYQDLMQNQDGCCAICRNPFDMSPRMGKFGINKPCVDHCHIKDEIRGILCGQCNRGLGFFKDSISNLENAIKYLNREFTDANK